MNGNEVYGHCTPVPNIHNITIYDGYYLYYLLDVLYIEKRLSVMMPHNDCFIEVFYVILIYSWSNVGCLSGTIMNFPDYKDWVDPKKS